MVAAIITGVLLGLISVIPFKVATKKIRTINPANSLSLLGPFLLTIALSFLILIAGMIVCKFVAPDVVIAFSVAEILAFAVGVIVFGAFLSKRQ